MYKKSVILKLTQKFDWRNLTLKNKQRNKIPLLIPLAAKHREEIHNYLI